MSARPVSERRIHAMPLSYIAERGQSGYHGVAIVSRLPLRLSVRRFCGKDDCRRLSGFRSHDR
jgi:exodeoxyribonuclease-3